MSEVDMTKGAPWDRIEQQLKEADSYNTTAEACRDAAVEAFEYGARIVGLTGFQASWAALQAYGEIMSVKCPFMVITLDNYLYPQYDLHARLDEFIAKSKEWIQKKAQEKLEQEDQQYVHPDVWARWEQLAK